MPSLEVSTEEAEALRTAIQSYLNDLQDEIGHTDDYDFRHSLQHRRDLLHGFLQRLGPPPTS